LRRQGDVHGIGPLCVCLASNNTSWVTGDVIQITGGGIPVGYLTYLHQVNARLGWTDE
jgi:hypothetical protein